MITRITRLVFLTVLGLSASFGQLTQYRFLPAEIAGSGIKLKAIAHSPNGDYTFALLEKPSNSGIYRLADNGKGEINSQLVFSATQLEGQGEKFNSNPQPYLLAGNDGAVYFEGYCMIPGQIQVAQLCSIWKLRSDGKLEKKFTQGKIVSFYHPEIKEWLTGRVFSFYPVWLHQDKEFLYVGLIFKDPRVGRDKGFGGIFEILEPDRLLRIYNAEPGLGTWSLEKSSDIWFDQRNRMIFSESKSYGGESRQLVRFDPVHNERHVFITPGGNFWGEQIARDLNSYWSSHTQEEFYIHYKRLDGIQKVAQLVLDGQPQEIFSTAVHEVGNWGRPTSFDWLTSKNGNGLVLANYQDLGKKALAVWETQNNALSALVREGDPIANYQPNTPFDQRAAATVLGKIAAVWMNKTDQAEFITVDDNQQITGWFKLAFPRISADPERVRLGEKIALTLTNIPVEAQVEVLLGNSPIPASDFSRSGNSLLINDPGTEGKYAVKLLVRYPNGNDLFTNTAFVWVEKSYQPVINQVISSSDQKVPAAIVPLQYLTLYFHGEAMGMAQSTPLAFTPVLGGVSIDVCGQPAWVLYNSGNGQVNFVVPAIGEAEGLKCDIVLKVFGEPSKAVSFKVISQDISPFLFLPLGIERTEITGPVMVKENGKFVGPKEWTNGFLRFAPAVAGEIIGIYANGCGLPATPFKSHVAPLPGAELANKPSVWIDGREAQVTWYGIVANTPGLCQLNVRVPFEVAPPAGDKYNWYNDNKERNFLIPVETYEDSILASSSEQEGGN